MLCVRALCFDPKMYLLWCMFANPKVHVHWNTTDSRKIISLFFQLPHFTGNFHVVNGCIDWRSALFVLRSVHHLRTKQEWEPRRFDIMGGSDQWLQHGLPFYQGCLRLHLNAFMFSAKVSVDLFIAIMLNVIHWWKSCFKCRKGKTHF